jgi:single-strand DNA-binding protein
MIIVQVAGRLGRDPETRFTPSGQKVTTLNIATNQRKGKEDITVWIRATVWGDRLDKMISYLKKGSAVIAIGKLNPPSTYNDKEGRPQISLEMTADMIEFSPFGKDDRAENQAGQGAASQEGYERSESSSYGGNSFGGYAKSTYGSQTVPGQGSQNNQTEDDNLPF